MKLGVLTGGGDVPGLNAAILAVVSRATELGHEVIGIERGWAGAIESEGRPLTLEAVSDKIGIGGTMLGTSRTNPLATDDGLSRAASGLERMGVQAVVAIGGDDTLSVARELAAAGFRTAGVPKTMDNDVGGTDYTIGFFTAAGIAVDAAERLRTTARSHRRIIVLEVMGRHAGWVALAAGIGAGAELTLIPELSADLDDVARRLERHYRNVEQSAIVVVAEGVRPGGRPVTVGTETDQFGHERLGGAGEVLAQEIRRRTGIDTRAVALGHIQRGGPPVLYDRLLGCSLGAFAADILDRGDSGLLAGWRGEQPVSIPLTEALAAPKLVGPDWVRLLCTLQHSVGC